jgi:hypothetical protein
MRSTIMMSCVALLMATSVQAATLNKCIDTQGQVTYSNLPCLNAREARAVEIDPAPRPDPVKPPVAKSSPVHVAPLKSLPSAPVSVPQVNTHPVIGKPVKPATASQCDSLTDKLGTVLDKMDQARRKGYTQEQMNKWNQEIEALETKKQRSGCF